MKHTKKLLSIFLSLCMILSITVGIDFSSIAATNYECEDNNSYSNANLIPLNSSISGSINYGSFENDSDIDYYKITTTQDGTLSIKFSHEVQLNSVASWNINVYKIDNFDMYLLTSFNAEAKKNTAILPELGLEAGTYYISITNKQYTCGMEYIITNTFSATATWETEFNNSYSTSDELKTNQYIEGCIGEGSFSNSDNADYDYYKINIPNSGKLKLSVYNTTENIEKYVYWNIEIYSFSNGSYNQLVSERVEANNTPYTFSTLSVTNGVYYIVVKNSQYAKGVNYKILNTFECNHSYNSIILKNPSCTVSGQKRNTCKYCGDTKIETIVAMGHNLASETVPADCTNDGYTTYTCTRCGDSYTETIPALGHTVVIDNGYAPTCTNTGLTEGSHCSVCGTVIKVQETIPAAGHDFGNNNRTCLTCGAVNPNYIEPEKPTEPAKLAEPTKPTQPTQPTTPIQPTQPSNPQSTAPIQPTQPTTQPSSPASPITTKVLKPKSAKISKLTKGKKQFKASWKKVSGVAGYQIQYSTSKKFTKKTTKSVTVKGAKKTSATVKKLKSKKKYYVRIRTYKTVNGKKVYSSWSKTKTVTTK